MTCDEIHGKLAHYVDSELPAGELADFESHLRGCSNCATEALELLQTKRAIRTAAATRYVPSPEFRLRMEQSIRSRSKRRWFDLRFDVRFPRLALAGVAALLLIASVTVLLNRTGRERELTEIADLHVTALASSNPVDVISTDKHTVKPWFAGKLPFSFNLPELQNSGFTLVGGRVAYFERSSGAQLLFSLRKHQLSVFIFKEAPREFPFHEGTVTSTRLALQLETWSEGGLRYFIVSDAPASDVHALSELLRKAARS
jgi:anti-sigma factor RsiW